MLLALPSLLIAGCPVPRKVPSHYSWGFSEDFAHVLVNNYCQLPGGVHQFFSHLLWLPSSVSAA